MKKKFLGFNNKYTKSPKDKSYYRQQFKVVLIGIIIVTLIILLKSLDVKPANDAIKLVNKAFDYDLGKNGKKLFGFINGIEDYDDYAVPVFQTTKVNYEVKEYTTPVFGTIFKNYGEIKKSNNNIEFNNGVDIIVNDDEVLNIKDGMVIDVGENEHGKFIKVNHDDYTSIYSGLDNIYVQKNEYIVKGQQIGNFVDIDKKVKKLHFEIWKGNKSVNPLDKIDFTSTSILN